MKARRFTRFDSAWAENPPSRTRRFVTSIRVYPGEETGAFEVSSSILMLRTRDAVEFVSARRDDILVERGGELRLKRRSHHQRQETKRPPRPIAPGFTPGPR